MRKLRTFVIILAWGLAGSAYAGSAPDPVRDYINVRSRQESLPYSVDVTISASIPSMGKVGKFHAVRRQAGQGKVKYEAMKFEGDGVIKTNVIARYLSAEVEAQKPEEKLATQITPANYEFKLKSREWIGGRELLIYQVKPLKKRPGLFQGHIWIDSETRQPVKEVGKLAKVSSVWVKAITFTREYTTTRGMAMLSRITSEVKTRIVGKASITVEFDNYRFDDGRQTASAGVPSDAAAPSRPLSDFSVPQLY